MEQKNLECPKGLMIAAMILVSINIGMTVYTNYQRKKFHNN